MKRGFLITGNLFLCKSKGGTKWRKMRKQILKELKTEEQSPHQNPDGILTKKDKWKDLCNRDIF